MNTKWLLGMVVLAAMPIVAAAEDVLVTSASPPEAKLASIDAQSTTVARATIDRYTKILNELEKRCPESREQIANFAVTGVKILKESKGVVMTQLQFLDAMNGSLPPGSESLGVKCAEIAAMLATLIDRQ